MSAHLRGLELEKLANESGLKAQTIYERAGFKRGHYYKILKKKDVSVDEFSRIVRAMGQKPGDLLENSGGVKPELKPIVDDLERLRPSALRRVRDLLSLIDDVAADAEAQTVSNVITGPWAEQRTEPQWSAEFPVKPEDFIGTGDGDYPLPFHGWDMNDLRGAAGPIGAATENPMGAILNMKEVRDGRVRTIKVQGDSMVPSLHDGEIVAVDVGLRQPKLNDPVAIYRPKDKGIIFGRWDRVGDRVRLLKDNDSFEPVELLEDDMLVGTVIDIVKKPVPPPPRKKGLS